MLLQISTWFYKNMENSLPFHIGQRMQQKIKSTFINKKCTKIVRFRFLEQFLIHVYTFMIIVPSPTSPLEKYEQNLNDYLKVTGNVS